MGPVANVEGWRDQSKSWSNLTHEDLVTLKDEIYGHMDVHKMIIYFIKICNFMRPFEESQRSPKWDQGSLRVTKRSQRWKDKRLRPWPIYTTSFI